MPNDSANKGSPLATAAETVAVSAIAEAFDHLPSAVVVFDRDQRIVCWNRPAAELFGIDAASAEGATCWPTA